MPLDAKHIAFCTTTASIPEIVATLDNAIAAETPDAYQWLHEFVAAEKAGKNRASIIKRVVGALKDWPRPADAPPAPESVGSPTAALDAIGSAIAERQKNIAAIHRRAQDDSLAHALCIGLRCYQAHMIFAMQDPAKRGQGRKSAAISSTVDGISKGGFEGWLEKLNETLTDRLSKGSAYRAMTAFRGLSLDEKATEEQVEFTLETLRHAQQQAGLPAPTLANLIAAATERLAPPAETPAPPPSHHQLTLDDYLATLKTFREDAETVIEQAKDMPDHLRKAAAARAYATLAALTGSAWQPAEEHDELGQIDPDTIAL